MPIDDETQAIYDQEDHIVAVAHQDIVRYPPVSLFPAEQATRLLRDYEKFLTKSNGISRQEAETLVANDLRKTIDALRSTLINLYHIGPIRSAVLLHVALFLGVDVVLKMKDLLTALRASEYDAAYRLLMLSSWPVLVGTTQNERMRVLNLAEQLRTGRPTPDNLVVH